MACGSADRSPARLLMRAGKNVMRATRTIVGVRLNENATTRAGAMAISGVTLRTTASREQRPGGQAGLRHGQASTNAMT